MPEEAKEAQPAPQEEKKYAEIPEDLDDAMIGNADGKATKYEIPKRKATRLVFTGTLRNRVFWSFILFFVIYVIVILIGYIFMHDGLSNVDNSLCEHNVERFSLELNSRLSREADLITRFATFDDMYEAVLNATHGSREPLEDIIRRKFYSAETGKWDTSLDLNLLVVMDTEFNVLLQHYFPPVRGSSVMEDDTVSTVEKTVNNVPSALFKAHGKNAWHDVLAPISEQEPMFVAFSPITRHTSASDPSGFLVLGREIRGRVKTAASSIPTCLTTYFGADEQRTLVEKDKDAFERSKSGIINTTSGAWTGKTSFAEHRTSWMDQNDRRFCPGNMLFDKTDDVMVCYMRIYNKIEKDYVESTAGGKYSELQFRLDIPTTVRVKGNPTLIGIVLEIMVIVAILLIIFFIYIDRAVLNRIRELSEIISQQTRVTEANKDLEISDTNSEDGIELSSIGGKRHHHRSGRDSGHKGDRSSTSTDSTGSSHSSSQHEDEVGRLRRAMEENALALRNKMDQADQALSQEQAYASRHKQALQLLNLWCGRKEYFPGLRTNALQLRYEPNRGLEDLLANPLAVEYLKVHCASEKTLENLLFLIDVAWLHEVEIAQANASDSVQREQLGAVAENAAQTIRARYIADDAPQPINISAETQERIAKGSEHYSLGMFDAAEQEVKLMLDTDILPRFKKTLAYTAMSETLFFDQTNGLDDVSASAFSDEAGSTAGSVLTDESDEMEGISRNFAHAFNRLHAAGTGTAGTTTGAGGPGTTTTMTTATTTTDGTDGSSVVSESKKHTAGTTTTTMSTTETSEGEMDEEAEDLEEVEDKKGKEKEKGKDKGKKSDGSPEGSASSSSSSHASSDLGSASDSSNSSSLSSSGSEESSGGSE